jgi:apolipoprotein N-acyltransferase
VALSAAAFGLYVLVEWHWFWLGWVGWIPWLATLERAPTWRHALLSAWLMCIAYVGAVFWWFAAGIADYTGAGVAPAALLLALFAPLVQPQIIVAGVLFHATRRSATVWVRSFAVASAYCGAEWALPRLFGDTIGHGFYASPLLRQAADIGGAPALTFVLLLANQWILEAMHHLRAARSRRLPGAVAPALALAAMVGVLSAYGAWRLRQLNVPPTATVNAAVVQSGLSHYTQMAAGIGTYEATRRILDAHFELSAVALEEGGIDLLVWPETVYPTTFGAPKSPDGAAFDKEIAALVTRSRVPLLFGSYDTEGGVEYNAAFFVEPKDSDVTFDTYRKGALFPLTERVPWPLDTAVVRRWFPWLGTWTPGGGARVIDVKLASGRPLRVAPMICYDAVDPERALLAARQGAEVIVTLSNDSWFAAGGGPRQHLVVSAFRTLETRLAQIRATTTGISAFITPTGEIIAGAGVGERAQIVARLPAGRARSTLMLAWGDWFGRASFALAVLCIAVLWVGNARDARLPRTAQARRA